MDMVDFIGPDINFLGDTQPKLKKTNKETTVDKEAEKLINLLRIWKHIPLSGQSQHIITDGSFDFYTFVQAAITRTLPAGFDEFIGTTWLMNQPIATDLIQQYDQGKIRSIILLVSNYLKKRTPSVYGYLKNEFIARKLIMKEGRIHAKLIMLKNEQTSTYLTIEGSANFTENPRTEQYLVTNSKKVYEHHKKWIDDFRW